MYHYAEKRIEMVAKNGKFQEEITDKEVNNGKVNIQKKIYQGIVDKGKLRKKKVIFMPKLEYIEPGYESYACSKPSLPKKTRRKRKKNKTKKERRHSNKNRNIKK